MPEGDDSICFFNRKHYIDVPSEFKTSIPELMFNTSLSTDQAQLHLQLSDTVSIQNMVCNSTSKYQGLLKKSMLRNIVLVGGNSMFEGFPKRLESEVRAISGGVGNVIAKRDRHLSVLRGGQLLA